MHRLQITAVTTALSAVAWIFGGERPSTQESASYVGVTLPSRTIAVGVPQSGVIERMAVREGEAVEQGAVLFKLSTRLEELEVERLRITVESRSELRAAQAQLVQAEREEKRYVDLHRRQIAGDAELDERQRQAELARIKLDQAKAEHQISILRHQEAQERLAQRTVRSPIQGYVARRLREQGEAVDELAPVLEIVRLDPMWVEFSCPVEDASRLPIGTEIRVRRAGEDEAEVVARVVFASRLVDAASQTFTVRGELPPKTRWKAGRKVTIVVETEH